jgi:uncharacterized damage-inducible protein DinB
MRCADVQLLWEYNTWANGKIFAAAAGLSEDQLQQEVHSGHGTLYRTLVHVYDTEYGWRMLAQHGERTPELTEQDVPTLAELVSRSGEESATWASYLGGLSDDDVLGILRYMGDEPRERVLWQVFYHVVNHGTYHRGECAAALTGLGRSPGELDFTIFLNERARGA